MVRRYQPTQNSPGPLLASYVDATTVELAPDDLAPLADKHSILSYLNNGGSMDAFANAAELVIAALQDQGKPLDIYTPWGYELVTDAVISSDRDPDPRNPTAHGIQWGDRVYLRLQGGRSWIFGNWAGRWFRLPERAYYWTDEEAVDFGSTSFLASGAADYSLFTPAGIAQGTLPGNYQWIPSGNPTLNPEGFIIDNSAPILPRPDLPFPPANGNGGVPTAQPTPVPAPPELLPPTKRDQNAALMVAVVAAGLFILSQ